MTVLKPRRMRTGSPLFPNRRPNSPRRKRVLSCHLLKTKNSDETQYRQFLLVYENK